MGLMALLLKWWEELTPEWAFTWRIIYLVWLIYAFLSPFIE